MKEKDAEKIGGHSTTAFVGPLAAVLLLLMIAIVFLLLRVNRNTNIHTRMMQDSSNYQQEVTDIQAGASLLTETAGNFALMPLGEDESVNVGPLMGFAQELGRDRRGPQVAERFRQYEVSREALGYVEEAASYTEQLLEIQLHVLSLMRSVYPLPPVPVLSAIPEIPLTQEELDLSPEERTDYARSLILNTDYSQLRFHLNEVIVQCHKTIQEDFNQASQEIAGHIRALRTALWAVLFAIFLLLAGTFILLYRWIVLPLRSYAKLIPADEELEVRGGIRELRLVAASYNELRFRRNKLEAILRSAAETDPLTGLPNRYSMERSVMELGEEDGSLTVLLFDVNFLKHVNDTEGHLAGDQLLRTAASCIDECFNKGENCGCYRIGGDEFAAVIKGCTEEEIHSCLGHFAWAQERENISVSVGYARAESVTDPGFRALMSQADQHMYEQKKRIHADGAVR
jgi:diguanylate cyclase (GGDEF)-like protein